MHWGRDYYDRFVFNRIFFGASLMLGPQAAVRRVLEQAKAKTTKEDWAQSDRFLIHLDKVWNTLSTCILYVFLI